MASYNYYTSLMNQVLSRRQTARLLGLKMSELNTLREVGNGFKFMESDEYIGYVGSTVYMWALVNVHAPRVWFDRFYQNTISDAPRTRIIFDPETSMYYLTNYEEARLLLSMIYASTNRAGTGLYDLYKIDHPAEKRAPETIGLRRTQANPPKRNVLQVENAETRAAI